MVAYAPFFCLPYLQGSDSPCLNTGTVCDPSSTWCDMIAIVDAQLGAVDNIVARTGSAIPLARVSYVPTAPVTIGNNVRIPFNVVDVDTDNMVDLSVLKGVAPRRNGVYEILTRVVVDPATLGPAEAIEEYFLQVGVEVVFNTTNVNNQAVGIGTERIFQPGSGFNTYSASAIWNFTDLGPLPRTVTLQSITNVVPIVRASLTVLWHSEAV